MDFKQFLTMVNEAESTAEKDDKAENAGKKVTKEIEADDKKDRKEKKKSLKDWFEAIDKKTLLEDQTQLVPNKFYVVGDIEFGKYPVKAGPFDDDGEAENEKAEYSQGGREDAVVAQWTGKDWNFDYMMEGGLAYDRLDPKNLANTGMGMTVKDKIKSRLGQDERGDARVRAGQERSTHLRNKPHLPEQGVAEGQAPEIDPQTTFSYAMKMVQGLNDHFGGKYFEHQLNKDGSITIVKKAPWADEVYRKMGRGDPSQNPDFQQLGALTGKNFNRVVNPWYNIFRQKGWRFDQPVNGEFTIAVNKQQGVAEAEQVTMEPAKQSTQIIKQGTKTLGTVSNPALAATIKSAIGKGEMSLAGDQLKEEPMMEKAPPGMEDVVLSLKKKFPGEEGRAYAIAWSMYNKKHGKTEAAEDNPDSAMLEGEKPKKDFLGKLQKKVDKSNKDKKDTEEKVKQHQKVDEKWAGDAKVEPTGEYSKKSVEQLKSMLAKLKKSGPHKKDSPEAKKQHQINFALRAKGGWKKGEGAAMKEAEIPNQGSDYGAGLGAGRNPKVLESKQVNEAMNTLEAAYHEGKSHGLSKHSYACRYNEGSEEHKRYHDGFKEGLDECYGLMPNRGLVVSEIESGQDVVDDMASYGAEEGSLGEMDKTAYMQHKAKTTPGDTFKAFGQTFKDKEVLETDAFAFESLDKQLNELLNEGEEIVVEGLSVNMSQGLDGPGGQMEDTVSVTAQGDDAGKLLQFIKQVGLGGLGADKPLDGPAEPAIAMVSDYGAPKFGGYDSEPKSMMDLMKVMSGGEDYKDEEGHDHGHDHHEEKCDECGTMMTAEGSCGCDEAKEVVDEVETPDQLEYQVAEDDGEGYEQGQEAAAQIDSALAASGSSKGGATNEDGMESSPLAADAVVSADAAEEEEAAMSESSFLNLYKKLSLLSEESTAEKDDKAEKAAKKVAKDIEYDEGHKGKDDNKAEKAGEKVKKDIEYDDKKDKRKKVDEWANDAGKDGTQQSFERDIEFMTKVIAGGLNKPKVTGQTTIPVIASQDARNGSDEDVAAWKRLAGLGK